jgi:protein-S-isoprenylcysteine O-methyltransferase Ste14
MRRWILTASRGLGSVGRYLLAGSTLTDRHLPAVLFGVLAILSFSRTLELAIRGLLDPGFSIGLTQLLDVAHHLLTSLFCGLIATLFLIRGVPRGERAGPTARAVALVGTFIMGVAAAQPPTTHDWRILAVSDALLVGGLAFSIYAAASLGGSFALAAEARELVTSGAYRLVRHPIYLGELVAATGALLPVLTPSTALIFVVFCLSQIARTMLEERALSAAFSQYEEYRRRTPVLVPWPHPSIRAHAVASTLLDTLDSRPPR